MPSQLAQLALKGVRCFLRAFSALVCAAPLLFPAFAAAARVVLSPGVQIPVRLDSAISTKSSFRYFGPVLTATLDQDINAADGRIAIPSGSAVKLAISDYHRAGHVSGRARFRLRLYSVALPDGSEVPLDGYPSLDNKPKPDKEGTFHARRGLIKDTGFDLAAVTSGAGAGLAVGGPWGLPAGAAGGLLVAGLWTVARRGPDLEFPVGTVISFTLGRPASVWVRDQGIQDAAIATSAASPCAAWGCDSVIPPSRDLLTALDSPGNPEAALQQLDRISFRNRPDTDRVFVAYLRGVNELRLSRPGKALGDLKEAYAGAKSLNLPASAQAEIARNLVLALKESSKNWEQSPIVRDPLIQAALVEPAGGQP